MASSTAVSSNTSRKPSKRRYQNIPGKDGEVLAAENNANDDDPLNQDGYQENENGEAAETAVVVDPAETTSCEMTIDDAIDRLGMGLFQYRILIAAGLCFAADAMEVLLLSFLSIVLKDEWDLTDDETAFITSMLFAGALVGTSVLGPLADKWGRRPIFLVAATTIAFCGMGTALAKNYEMILVIMFAIGFGVGGLTVPFDTLAEFLPSKGRGTNLLLIEYFWTLGCLLVIVFAELTMAHGKPNWRLFVVLCSLPCFVSILCGYLYVPESVRWLVSEGRTDEALEILRQAARTNKLKASVPLTQSGEGSDHDHEADDNSHVEDDVDLIFPLDTQLTSTEDHSAENSASYCDLLKPQWRGTILRLWGAWGGFGLGYYGAIMAVTKVFDSEESKPEEMGDYTEAWYNSTFLDTGTSSNSTTFFDANATLLSYSHHPEEINEGPDFDYGAIFISSSAELVGTTLVILLVDRVGRIPSQVVCYASAGVCIFLLCTLASTAAASGNSAGDRWELVGLGFLLRALDMAATCTSWVMTAEVLSTEIRSTGHSSANAMARLGAFFSPFIVDTMSLQALGVVMLAVHWFTAACVCQLPETKGAHMGGGGGADATDHIATGGNIQMAGGAEEEPDGLFVIDSPDENEDDERDGNGPDIRMIT